MDDITTQLRSLQATLDILVKKGQPVRPRERLSIIMLIIVIVSGVLGGVLAEYLMIELGIKDGRRPWIILSVTIVFVVMLFALRRLI